MTYGSKAERAVEITVVLGGSFLTMEIAVNLLKLII